MAESQKETFRKYLEQAGAIDVLVKGACRRTGFGTCARGGVRIPRRWHHSYGQAADSRPRLPVPAAL